MSEETLVTASELSRVLKLSPRTIRDLVKAGRIPEVRINHRVVRFDPVKVKAALEKATPAISA